MLVGHLGRVASIRSTMGNNKCNGKGRYWRYRRGGIGKAGSRHHLLGNLSSWCEREIEWPNQIFAARRRLYDCSAIIIAHRTRVSQ